MSKNQKLGVGLALVAVSGIVLLFSAKTKKAKKRRQLHQVSEEGYETAHDVLYPLRFQRGKRKTNL